MAARGEFGEFAALEHYRLTGIQVKRRELGHGSYATVVELEYKGLKCAGKRIHRILLKVGNQGAEDIAQRFENECDLLSQTRHPNIVQFLGVYFEDIEEHDEDGEEHLRVPILVMEFLPTTLANCIDRYGVLPPEISYSILRDVALGLYYLHSHSPPIIHRDLSANNVLLTDSMTAKISDLGVARIINLNPLEVSRLTRVPGTLAYMPPETFSANPRYNTSMDVFSFGIMLIHVFSGRWPFPLCDPTRPNPRNHTQLIAVSEADRHNEYLDQIGRGHPLMDLILRCISNDPGLRGTALEIVQRMEAMVQQFRPTYANRIEMLWQLRSEERKKQSLRTVNKRLVGEIGQLAIDKQEEIRRNQAEHQAQIADLRRRKETEVAAKEAEITTKNRELQHLRRVCKGAREEVAQLNNSLQTSRRETNQLGEEVAQKQAENETQNQQIQHLTQDGQTARAKMAQLNDALQTSRREANRLGAEVTRKRVELKTQNQQIQHLTRDGQVARAGIAQLSDALQTSRRVAEQLGAEVTRKRVENKTFQTELERRREEKERSELAYSIEVEQLHLQLAESNDQRGTVTAQLQAVEEEKETYLTQNREIQIQIATKEAEIADLQLHHQAENARKEAEIANIRSQKEVEIATKEAEVSSKDAELSVKDRELAAKIATLKRKDSELASKNATLERKSTTIRGLNDQLSRAREYLSSNLQPHLFHPQTRITWKDCADLPEGTYHAQTVVNGDKVYVGGGYCFTTAQEHHVFSYSLSEDVWNSLPDCPMRWFGMGQLEGRVVAIGGVRRSDGRITNEVYVLDEDSQSWKDSIIPPITTPCYSPAVLSHHSSLIVAGGWTRSGPTSVVELFRRDTSQWHRTCPLPFPCSDMSSVVIQNTAYLLGVYGSEEYPIRVVYASVDSLLQKSLPPDQTSEDSDSVWKTLPNTPHYGSAAATISGCLLTVGGGDTSKHPQKEVYIYSPSTASWLHVSDLPSPRRDTTTAMISPTEFLVIGGEDSSITRSHSVFKASIEIH